MLAVREPAPAPPTGFVAALRALADGLLASLQERVELLGLELQEEKLRLIQLFAWIRVIVFTGIIALTFASLALVYYFWESARLAVLALLAGAYAVAFVAGLFAFRCFVARQPQPFEGTVQELTADRTCIRNGN